jgi:uncharacterized protein (TIGR02145 family)
MKKILLILLILPLIGFGQLRDANLVNTMTRAVDYKGRVLQDLGTINSDNLLKACYYMLEENGLYMDTRLLFMPEAGIKTRVDGLNTFVTTGYDLSSFNNNPTQATASSQPYLSGYIAPNEKLGVKVALEERKITHPNITFLSSNNFTLCFRLAWDYRSASGIIGSSSFNDRNLLSFRRGATFPDQLEFFGNSTSGQRYLLGTNNKYIGVYSTLHIVYDGTTIKSYYNGELDVSTSFIDGFATNTILAGFATANRTFNGRLNYYRIQNGAMSAAQIAAEHAWLRSVYPEIPNITIGGKQWASSNFVVVASTNGTVITQSTSNADWATGAARWQYYNADVNNHYFGNIYNSAARNIIIANPPGGWRLPTEAEATLLIAEGNGLKVKGTDYWTSANGTNQTGFTALGGGMRNPDGTWSGVKDSVDIWVGDALKVLRIRNSGTHSIVTVNANHGAYIRLIKQ